MRMSFGTMTASLAMLALSGGVAVADQSPGSAMTQPPAQHGTTATGAPLGAAAEMENGAEHFGSFAAEGERFDGTIAGGYSADELLGQSVVGPDDETVGSIADLLIGADNQVTRVLVDVGGFLGFGARTVAIDINALEPPVEDDGDFRIAMTREEVENLPEFEQDEQGWFSM
ncbi:MAG: PRC-barrel domain containing protein [Geminicoccaceae bacterium]|nr:MAG: PRC-barrel domain containing protein [Geminicoccaceae bacterium]